MNIKDYSLPVYSVVVEGDSYRVLRNQRPLMTPKGHVYDLPNKALADVVAQEWIDQGDKIVPATMPITQLTATVLDVMAQTRSKVIKSLLAYTRSELLCHRATRPEKLVERQEKEWQPILDWCNEHFGLSFTATTSVMPAPPSQEMEEILNSYFAAHDDFWLTGVQQAVDVAGSLVLGLALTEQHITAQQAFELSELDVTQQHKVWGMDPVTEGRQKSVLFDLEAVEKWFGLLK